jgi:hypothetical protein
MLAVLEDYLADDQRALDSLAALRNGNTKLWQLPVFASKTLMNAQGNPIRDYAKDMRQSWFGIQGNQQQQKSFDAQTNPTTGTWLSYYGDVERITRVTIRRALEIALGVAHDDPQLPLRPLRHWPIEFFWKCGQSWFEGWITWRTAPGGAAHVVVTFATPHDGTPVLANPTTGKLAAPFGVSPARTAGVEPAFETWRTGMVVVTHEDHVPHPPVGTRAGSGPGSPGLTWPRPGTRYQGMGAIVAVSPHEFDGGVSDPARHYEKP